MSVMVLSVLDTRGKLQQGPEFLGRFLSGDERPGVFNTSYQHRGHWQVQRCRRTTGDQSFWPSQVPSAPIFARLAAMISNRPPQVGLSKANIAAPALTFAYEKAMDLWWRAWKPCTAWLNHAVNVSGNRAGPLWLKQSNAGPAPLGCAMLAVPLLQTQMQWLETEDWLAWHRTLAADSDISRGACELFEPIFYTNSKPNIRQRPRAALNM
jgi:hypothetical protein